MKTHVWMGGGENEFQVRLFLSYFSVCLQDYHVSGGNKNERCLKTKLNHGHKVLLLLKSNNFNNS